MSIVGMMQEAAIVHSNAAQSAPAEAGAVRRRIRRRDAAPAADGKAKAKRQAPRARAAAPGRKPRSPAAAAARPTPTSTPAQVAAGLTKYIPTEAVALYTAILPFLVPDNDPLSRQDYTSRWFLAIGVAVAAVLFGVGVFRREVLTRGAAFQWPVNRTVIILVAFVAWVIVIPGSPFGSFKWYSPTIGAVLGIVAAAAISLYMLWFGGPEDVPGANGEGGEEVEGAPA